MSGAFGIAKDDFEVRFYRRGLEWFDAHFAVKLTVPSHLALRVPVYFAITPDDLSVGSASITNVIEG